MCLTHEAPPPDAPGFLQGGRGHHAHVHVRGMAVVLQAAQAALLGCCTGNPGAISGVRGGPSLRQPRG